MIKTYEKLICAEKKEGDRREKFTRDFILPK